MSDPISVPDDGFLDEKDFSEQYQKFKAEDEPSNIPTQADAPAEPPKAVEPQDDKTVEPTEAPAVEPPKAEEPAWDSRELPPNHWAREKGVTTFGQLDQMYRASSAEVRSQREQYERREEAMIELMKQFQSQIKSQQPKQWFGFKDEQEYQRAYAQDPHGALAKAIRFAVKNDPEFQKDILDPYLQPLQEQRLRETMASHVQTLQTKYPEAKNDTPEFKAAVAYVESQPWVQEVAKANPKVNFAEIMFKAANYDLLKQKYDSLDKKMVDKRGKSATVRTGTGGKTFPANTGSQHDNMRAVAADLADKGITVPESWLDGMAKVLKDELN